MRSMCLLALVTLLSAMLSGCPPIPDTRVHYISFGDSVTQGLPEGSYPGFLESLLINYQGEQPGCVANRGQSGDEVCQSHIRLQETIQETLFPNAHTVLYWEGGNDLMWYLYYNNFALDHGPTPEDRAQIDHIVFDCIAEGLNMIRSAGLTPYVGTYYHLVPGTNVFGWGQTTEDQIVFANQYIDELNAQILSMAGSEGITAAPIHTLGVLGDGSDTYYLEDGAHPDVAGYQLIAQVWYDAVTESLW